MVNIKEKIIEQLLSLIKNVTPKEEIELYNLPIIDDYNIFKSICDSLLTREFFSLNSIKEIKFIFQNMKNFHRYLYDKEEVIYISIKEENINIAFLFYLDLLINDDNFKCVINYSFSYEDIIKINELQKTQSEPIIKIVIGKIIIDLINHYKELEDFDEDNYEKYIKPIGNENKKLIEDNIKKPELKGLLEWEEKDIYAKKIDKIFIEIIEAFIKKGKFENYEYVSNILMGLDFDFIDNTNDMKNSLIEIFDTTNFKKKYQTNYIIENKNEIESKVNFYYFLIKYILKNSFDLYQFPLLLNMRNKLIKLIKENPSELLLNSDQDKGTKERFYFIIKSLLDNEYYLKKLYVKKKINNSTLESSLINDSQIKERSSSKGIIDFDKKVDSNQFPKESKIDEKYLSEIKEIERNTRTYKELSNNILALVVSDVDNQNADKLIFYDKKKKEKRMIITGYSFSQNEYSSEIILKEDSIIFLCGCKNIQNKKNGILVINKKREEEKDICINFLETGELKVDSICHIIDDNNNNNNKREDCLNDNMYDLVEYINKDFILVGGENENENDNNHKGNDNNHESNDNNQKGNDNNQKGNDNNNKGKLKLFQLEHNKYSFNCEFVKDIVVEKNQQKSFQNSVDFIQQIKESGKILVGSMNELYLFKKPNLEKFYIENELFPLSHLRSFSNLDRSSNSYNEDLISLSIEFNQHY